MRVHYPALDGLRAIAVITVMLGHSGLSFPRSGGVGVDIFFVLSGFLITGILSDEIQTTGRLAWRNFYLRRFLRLMPCLILATALFATLYIIKYGYFPGEIVAVTLTYTMNWALACHHFAASVMGHTWSLAIEEQYYLLWPAVIYLLEKHVKTSTRKFLTLGFFAVALALYRNALVGHVDASRLYFGLDTHMDGLVLGSALTYFVASFRSSDDQSARLLRTLSHLIVPAALAGLLFTVYITTWTHPLMGRFGFFCVAAASAVLIADLVLSPFSFLKSALSTTPLVYIGRISYGLYLFHYPLFDFIEYIGYGKEIPFKLALKFGVALLFAIASYHLIEKRVLNLKRKFPPPPASPIQPAFPAGQSLRF